MRIDESSLPIRAESTHTTLAKEQLLASLRSPYYRREFVRERVKSSVALQIRALREQRNKMTQKELGEAIGMAQTWISKLENPEYGKMTVATLVRLAVAFDTDLEIKFRPFSTLIDNLPMQDGSYYDVPSFTDEYGDLRNDVIEGHASEGLSPTRPNKVVEFPGPMGGEYESAALVSKQGIERQGVQLQRMPSQSEAGQYRGQRDAYR